MTKVAHVPDPQEHTAAAPAPSHFALSNSENDPMASVTTRYGEPARALSEQQANLVEDLSRLGVLDELVQHGWLTPSHLAVFDGITFLVQPELLPASRPGELAPVMRRDAARVILEVSCSLDRCGYVLAIADMSVLFVGKTGRLQFHDLPIIRRKKEGRAFPYSSFHAGHLAPVRLLARRPATATLVQRAGTIDLAEDIALRHPIVAGLVRLAGGRFAASFHRLTVTSPFAGLLHTDLFGTFVKEAFAEVRRRRRGETAPPQWTARLIDRLIQEIKKSEPSAADQHWTNYYARGDLAIIAGADGDQWRRHYDDSRAQELIQNLGPGAGRSLIDIGANQGYYAMLAAHCGFSVTAVDFDIAAINALYTAVHSAGHVIAVRPLVVDFVAMQPADYPRFRADVAIALGFVHHMRLVELLPWPVIAAKLSGLANDVLITEFKPDTKARGSNPRAVVEDYDVDSFVSALRPHFSTVEVVGSHTAPGSSSQREMIVCRK